ncbi:MAG TPA: hypothetical protein VGM91_23695 [Conexibacter sp.]|jgi:hypothetical protein
MPFAPQKVVFATENDLEWLALKDTPGFDGHDIPGVFCKFFGKEEKGPWFYLVRHEPGVVVPRHSHDGDVFHYILEGEWRIGKSTKVFGPGFMQYEQKGLYYGPLISGDEGSLFLAIYDNAPLFIEPPEEQRGVSPEADYE